ncbi:MAG: DUF3822 family protein [Prevotella sp.]|nr:DUF3822 family protein [Prevotella sp.]
MSTELNQRRNRIVLRIGQHHLSFSSIDMMTSEAPVTYEPYVIKSGISLAANLREALKGASLQQMGYQMALVMVDAPVLLIPIEVFEVSNMAEMYAHSFPSKEPQVLLYNVQPDLNAVAVYAINKDVKTVLDDNFPDLKMMAAVSPVWKHLHRRSFTGMRNKIYGYFHDGKLDIMAFQQNHFRFYNQFETSHTHDALYFLLYVWNQLMLDVNQDELHLVGEIREKELLLEELHQYLQNVYVINPTAEFNRAPATLVKGMPFDLVTLFTKGR